jgi:hypothetical protein
MSHTESSLRHSTAWHSMVDADLIREQRSMVYQSTAKHSTKQASMQLQALMTTVQVEQAQHPAYSLLMARDCTATAAYIASMTDNYYAEVTRCVSTSECSCDRVPMVPAAAVGRPHLPNR